jgi:hypothetical protein
LLESGDEAVYLTYILHVKRLPHCPYVPKELLVRLLLFARTSSPLHANIVDEILVNSLKEMLETGRFSLDHAPFVLLVDEVVVGAMREGAKEVLPDTAALLGRNRAGVSRYARMVKEDPILDWVEEQQAAYRKQAVRI